MARTVASAQAGTRANRLSDISTEQLKAELKPEPAGTRLREIAAEALKRTSSQKAAAIDIAISEGRLSSKLKDGSLTLAQLEKCGEKYIQRLGEVCRETTGAETPQERMRRKIREAQQKLAEAAEAL